MEEAIRVLDKYKSPDVDRVPVIALKDAVHLASKPLTLLYNAFLEKGYLLKE